MLEWLRQPWPWYVAGPLIGLFVPLLLWMGNKPFGVSSSLRAMCAAVAPGKIDFFNYDWRGTGGWSIAFVAGILAGAVLAATLLGVTTPDVSPRTHEALAALGLNSVSGLVPAEVFSWRALLSVRGFVSIVAGGFLVGFGATYAGGCTSGHGITGLASLELSSLVAVVAMFVGGVFATFALLPLVL